MTLRVAFLGDGHLATAIAALVARSRPYEVIGAYGRADRLPDVDAYDLLVEVATPAAVPERVLPAVQDGASALIASVGALADVRLRQELTEAHGRAFVATGAIGGLDHIRALALGGGVERAAIESRKLPATLIQSWMDDDLVVRLTRGDERIVLAHGRAADVAAQFPRSANVAVAVALAADAWSTTMATVVADPSAEDTVHVIAAWGSEGSCRFEVTNLPSPDRPRSSAVVAPSLLRSIDAFAAMSQHAGSALMPLL